MMHVNRELYLKYIEDCIAFLSLRIRQLNAGCLYDVNHIAEDVYCEILNAAFHWNLENINAKRTNAAFIDLISTKRKICIQVSSQCDNAKVNHSLSGLVNNSKYKNYRFKFLSLVKDPDEWNKGAFKFKLSQPVKFNPKSDLLGPKSLYRAINKLHTSTLAKVYQKCRSLFDDASSNTSGVSAEVFSEFIAVFSDSVKFECQILEYCNDYCNGYKDRLNSIHHLLSNQLNSEYSFVANHAPHLRILLLRNHDILSGIKTLELYHGKIESMIREDKSHLDVPAIRDVIEEEFNVLRNVLTLFATNLGADKVDVFTEFSSAIQA